MPPVLAAVAPLAVFAPKAGAAAITTSTAFLHLPESLGQGIHDLVAKEAAVLNAAVDWLQDHDGPTVAPWNISPKGSP